MQLGRLNGALQGGSGDSSYRAVHLTLQPQRDGGLEGSAWESSDSYLSGGTPCPAALQRGRGRRPLVSPLR